MLHVVIFNAVDGRFVVRVDEQPPPPEELWFRSVGKFLRNRKPPVADSETFSHYMASGVGSRTADGVRCKMARPLRSYGVCSFEHNACAPVPPVVVPHNVRRTMYRQFRREVEEHWATVWLFVCVLCHSLGNFRLANLLLSWQGASLIAPGSRRQRLRSGVCDVTLPHFTNVRSFTQELIAWAARRIPMGSLVQHDDIILDNLSEVLGSLASVRRWPSYVLGLFFF